MKSKRSVVSQYHPVEARLPCGSYFHEYKHHAYPGLNLGNPKFDGKNVIKTVRNYYERPTLLIHKPLPCLSVESSCHSLQMKDPVMQLVRKKSRWYKKKHQLLHFINKKKQNLKLKERKWLKPQSNLPYGVASLTEHLSKNPDRYFKGVYNWYYGNVTAATVLHGDSYLLHVGGKNLSDLYLSAVENRERFNFIPAVKQKFNVRLTEDCPIYDIITSNYNEYVGIRQRDVCSYLIRDDDENAALAMKTGISVKRSKYPFFGMDIEKDEFCTVDANRIIKFWTLDTCRCKGTVSVPDRESFTDSFVRVKYVPDSNFSTYLVADRRSIYFFDKRVNFQVPCLTWKPETFVELCEDISLLLPSKVANYWYFGLTHSCLSLDIRSGFVQKWSHMLSQTPTVGDVLKIDQKNQVTDAVLLSTQSTNEVVAIYNNWRCDETSGSCFPISVPSRIDTLHESGMKGVSSHPKIRNKFDCSLIGLCGYKEKTGIFSLGSSGDVFYQSIETENIDRFSEENIQFCADELSYLEEWEQDLLNKYTGSLSHVTVTDVVSMTEIADKLEETFDNPEWIFKDATCDTLELMSEKNFESFTDVLSMPLFKEFGLDDLEYKTGGDDTRPGSNVRKVEAWLFQTDIVDENVEEIPGTSLQEIHDQTVDSNDDKSSILSFKSESSSETSSDWDA